MTGANAAGMGLQMINNAWTEDRQYRKQRKLMDKSVNQSKELSEFNRAQQMRLWEDTNYNAQIKQMAKAGLSAGLIYGQGGAGGTVAVDNAQVSAPTAPMGATPETKAMGLEVAQTKALEAQAEKTKAETEKLEGVDTKEAETRIDALKAQTTNEKVKTTLNELSTKMTELDVEIKGRTVEYSVERAEWESQQQLETLQQLKLKTFIDKQTYQDIITEIKANAVNAVLNNEATKVGIELTKAQKDKIYAEIKQLDTINDQRDKEIELKRFAEELKSEYPGLGQAGGKIINEVLGFITIMTGNPGNYRRTGVEKM